MTSDLTLSVEAVLGTPLQVTREDGEVIVEIRNAQGEKVELKRFTDDR